MSKPDRTPADLVGMTVEVRTAKPGGTPNNRIDPPVAYTGKVSAADYVRSPLKSLTAPDKVMYMYWGAEAILETGQIVYVCLHDLWTHERQGTVAGHRTRAHGSRRTRREVEDRMPDPARLKLNGPPILGGDATISQALAAIRYLSVFQDVQGALKAEIARLRAELAEERQKTEAVRKSLAGLWPS